MFKEINEINLLPKPFQFYTANELWTNKHTAKQMLQYHVNADIDVLNVSVQTALMKK